MVTDAHQLSHAAWRHGSANHLPYGSTDTCVLSGRIPAADGRALRFLQAGNILEPDDRDSWVPGLPRRADIAAGGHGLLHAVRSWISAQHHGPDLCIYPCKRQ